MGKKRKIIRDKLKDRTFNNFWTLFEKKKEERKKKNHNGRINKNIIITDIRTLFLKQKKEKKKKQESK